jgi:hypothetical protein
VTEVLRGDTHLPASFPFAVLDELCAAMTYMQFGTGEGCNMPLTYACHTLPLWRKKNFILRASCPKVWPKTLPTFCAANLRTWLNLYGAVGTALDDYRAQAQAEYGAIIGP